MYGVFTLAMKFDCLFLGIFKVFIDLWLYFWQIAPPPHPEYMFQKML